jgi:hypothetical protein
LDVCVLAFLRKGLLIQSATLQIETHLKPHQLAVTLRPALETLSFMELVLKRLKSEMACFAKSATGQALSVSIQSLFSLDLKPSISTTARKIREVHGHHKVAERRKFDGVMKLDGLRGR